MEIVAAIDHDVVLAHQGERVVRREAHRMHVHRHAGIDLEHRGPREFRLAASRVRQRIDGLAMQIARVQRVGVHQPQMPDARAGEILHHRAAESAETDDEHAAARQALLSGRTDFLESHLARIVGQHRAHEPCAAAAQCSQLTHPESP